MPRYSIANLDIQEDKIRQYYLASKQNYKFNYWDDLDIIFEIALRNRDRFPNINLTARQSPQAYIDRWVRGYYEGINNLPSKRTATPKSTCTDPAIRIIVKATQKMSKKEADIGEENHNLFMSAENIQGNLLEEYIAFKTRPYGILWCVGNVLRATDFCNTDGSLMLQVKNKSNTENSSSSTIREGTEIQKWYRLGTKTRKGIKYPDYKWMELNNIINLHKTQGMELAPLEMDEDEYQKFLKKAASKNSRLITSL